MRKSLFASLLLFLFIMGFTGCTARAENPSSVSPELDMIRSEMQEKGCCISIAYLGWLSGEYSDLTDFFDSNGILEHFPFLARLGSEQLVACKGEELYLVVPAEGTEIIVRDWIIDESTDYAGKAGTKELYRSSSDLPFLLKCNESDIMSNSLICVSAKTMPATLEYSPYISLRDGCLWTPGVYESGCGVMDITPYPPFISAEPELAAGIWEGFVIAEDGRDSYRVYMELYENGSLYYLCSLYTDADDAPIYIYNGTWQYVEVARAGQFDKVYDFDLSLSRVIGQANGEAAERISTRQLVLIPWDGTLSLQIMEGDCLYPNNWEYEVYLDRAA